MGFTYQTVTRAAYHLAGDAAPWTESYLALPFPEQARESLLHLCNYGRKEGAEPFRTVPTRRLDGALQALAPDLIVRPRPRTPVEPDADFWLYAPAGLPHPLPEQAMHQLLASWLRDLGAKDAVGTPGYRQLLLDTYADLKAQPLTWQEAPDIDLLGCDATEGGTAAPVSRQFQLATDALARRIMELEPFVYDQDSGAGLRFRAVARGPKEQGAELMSQPISRSVKGEDRWFSITINISLHTVPFEPRPRLHLHTGVRRWATSPRRDTGLLHLPYGRDTSVYLRPASPWLPGASASERYAVARLVRARSEEQPGANWRGNDPAGVLQGLTLTRSLPDPVELLRTPLRWLGEGEGTRAAVVHSNHMGSHGIGAGLMSHQRSQIIEWAQQALPKGLVRVPDLTRSSAGSHKPANARERLAGVAKKAEETRAAQARRVALALAVRESAEPDDSHEPPVLKARLLWQSAALRQEAIAALAEILGLDGDGGAPQPDSSNPDAVAAAFDDAKPATPVILRWESPELTLQLRCLPLAGGLADRLDLDPTARSKTQNFADVVKARRAALVNFLAADGADPGAPTLALVEIAHRSTFRPSRTDPKFAIRLGCADAGVLTQFAVVPSAEKGVRTHRNVAHRVRSGWLDGLRQLGVRALPEHTLGGNLPEQLRYAAVWMVKRRKDGPTRLPKHVPVAVLVTPLPHGEGLARIQGWDDEAREWIPYPAFLLGLVKKAEISLLVEPDEDDVQAEPLLAVPNQRTDPATGAESGTAADATRLATWVTSAAWHKNLDEQRRETARFLQRMLHSLRGQPTALITHSQNSRLHWPWLQDGRLVADLIKTGHAQPAGLDFDLRLIRVRGAAGRETPQWWGTGSPDGINGLPAGLWTEPVELGADQRVFYSTTEKAGTFKSSAVILDRLAPRVLTRGDRAGELTSDADVPAWNPTMVEIAVLGCHLEPDEEYHGDKPEAYALAMHQLRQAPDYLDALALPLPLHLAGLAQAYVLPMFANDADESAESEADAADLDPDQLDAPGLAREPDLYGQAPLFS
jgi:hypothetical protein